MPTHIKKVAFVTGGAKRIGQGICIALAKAGYSIALHYGHSKSDAEKTANQIRRVGCRCLILPCDLADAHAAEKLIPCVLEEFGRLDVLINSASIFEKSLLTDDVKIFDRNFSVNFRSPYVLMRSFARNIDKGCIVNVLDAHVVNHKTPHSAYLLSKKALADLTSMAAIEFAPNIRVNAVAPGLILPPEGHKASYLDRLAKKIPLQRKGHVSDVTSAIEFILDNDYITGQVVYVNGGEHLI